MVHSSPNEAESRSDSQQTTCLLQDLQVHYQSLLHDPIPSQVPSRTSETIPLKRILILSFNQNQCVSSGLVPAGSPTKIV